MKKNGYFVFVDCRDQLSGFEPPAGCSTDWAIWFPVKPLLKMIVEDMWAVWFKILGIK